MNSEKAKAGGVFTVKCVGKDGTLKWEHSEHNLVVNEGLKYMNDTAFYAGTPATSWYLGLYGAAASNTPAATDTMALHPGWTEVVAYTQATRPACVFAAGTLADPSVMANIASPATFTINATTVVGGAFLTSNNVKGGSTGILFSAADFQVPGDRNVTADDSLFVTYQFSLDAA